MKVGAMNVLRAGLMGLVEALLTLPVLLLVHLYIIQGTIFWLWALSFALVYMIGCLLRSLWPTPKLIVWHLMFILMSALYSWLWFGLSVPAIASTLVIWLALYRGGLYAVMSIARALPTTFYIFSITAYFLFAAVTRFAESMESIVEPLSWFALVTIGVTLFMMNRNALDQESLQGGSKQSVGASILWKNRALITVFAVIVVLVANFRMLLDGFQAFFRKIGEWISWLMNLGTDGEPVEEISGSLDIRDNPLFGEDQEPFWLWVWLEEIFKWVAVVVGILIAVYLLYKLIRLTITGIKVLYGWIMNRLEAGAWVGMQDQTYEDEEEKLADWSDLRKQWGDRIRSMFEREQKDRWDRQTNNIERIRYLYRQAVAGIIRDGYRYSPALTPRETKRDADRWRGKVALPDDLVREYEQARYKGEAPSDEQISSLKSWLDKQ